MRITRMKNGICAECGGDENLTTLSIGKSTVIFMCDECLEELCGRIENWTMTDLPRKYCD